MNKKKKKTIKITVVIFSLIIPMGMLFGFLIPYTKANGKNNNIPERPDSRNNWHWNVTEGDLLIYEIEIKLENLYGPEAIVWKALQIYNITSFQNVTMNYMGEGQKMSLINATNMYYDPITKKLDFTGDPFQIAIFGYNRSHQYPERYAAGPGMIIPFILPINGTESTKVNATLMAEILYNTHLGPAIANGFIMKNLITGSMRLSIMV